MSKLLKSMQRTAQGLYNAGRMSEEEYYDIVGDIKECMSTYDREMTEESFTKMFDDEYSEFLEWEEGTIGDGLDDE